MLLGCVDKRARDMGRNRRFALCSGSALAAVCCLFLSACSLTTDTSCFPGNSINASCLEPAPSEIRQARADAKALAEMRDRGGNILYRPDGSSSNPASVKYVAAPEALTLDIRASDDLNFFDGAPHALVLRVYHLSDLVAFNQLAKNASGIATLLEGEHFDASVKASRQVFVQPGLCESMVLPRAEDGRYVALVAGYGGAEPGRIPAVFATAYGVGHYQITETSNVVTMEVKKKVDMFAPRPLRLRVELGAGEMSVWQEEAPLGNCRDGRRVYRASPPPRPGEM